MFIDPNFFKFTGSVAQLLVLGTRIHHQDGLILSGDP